MSFCSQPSLSAPRVLSMEVRVWGGMHGLVSEMGPQSLAVSPQETGPMWAPRRGRPRLCGPGEKARVPVGSVAVLTFLWDSCVLEIPVPS